ncbi:MAG TPA: PLDc N-terminal domain-containing protein [Flavisolibacter sp.]|nr:PLDc N-terminal domain-containing protein [Flavisolibacter sp.]
MANTRHPNFLFALLSIVVGGIAIGFRANRHNAIGDTMLLIAGVMGIITWVWAIIEVQKTDSLEGSQKKFWRIAVVAIPFFGALLYYMLHSKRNTIVD